MKPASESITSESFRKHPRYTSIRNLSKTGTIQCKGLARSLLSILSDPFPRPPSITARLRLARHSCGDVATSSHFFPNAAKSAGRLLCQTGESQRRTLRRTMSSDHVWRKVCWPSFTDGCLGIVLDSTTVPGERVDWRTLSLPTTENLQRGASSSMRVRNHHVSFCPSAGSRDMLGHG